MAECSSSFISCHSEKEENMEPLNGCHSRKEVWEKITSSEDGLVEVSVQMSFKPGVTHGTTLNQQRGQSSHLTVSLVIDVVVS